MGYVIAFVMLFTSLGAALALVWALRQSIGAWEPEQFTSPSVSAWKDETERMVDWHWTRVDRLKAAECYGAVYRAACEAREAGAVREWFI